MACSGLELESGPPSPQKSILPIEPCGWSYIAWGIWHAVSSAAISSVCRSECVHNEKNAADVWKQKYGQKLESFDAVSLNLICFSAAEKHGLRYKDQYCLRVIRYW